MTYVDPEAARPAEPAPPAPAPAAPPSSRHGRYMLVAVVVVALVALFWPHGKRGGAPGGFLVDAGGRPAPLAERMAPVTLLHFYASWCPPCVQEAPALARLRKDLGGDPRFRVVMVAVQDDVGRAQLLAGSGDVLFDPQWETAHRYGTAQLPESYLIVDGRQLRKFDGPVDWDDPQVRSFVKGAVDRVGASS